MKIINIFKKGTVTVALFVLLIPSLNAQLLSEQTFKIARLLGLIENFYIDTVDMEMVTRDAIVALLRSLDPHSAYIPADEVAEMNEPLLGNFEGIGIQFNILNDTILVTAPIPGGPSEKVGIMPGDRIVTIEDEDVAGVSITTTGVRNRLLGEKGTKVRVGVYRRGTDGITEFTITRDKIPVNSLDASYMIDEETGYIKLNRFSMSTEDEFNEAVEKLRERGMKNIILDLRGNSGGVMAPAVAIADAFLSDDRMVVYLEGKSMDRQDFRSSSETSLADARVVVLTDEGSASASEILAGALQDWDRGVVIGRRTFGKGLVQNGFTLTDGSMVRLTVARYYTPSGRSIQSPYADGYDRYMEEFMSRYARGEQVSSVNIAFPDSLQAETLVNRRVVFGGGGIMPDLFIGADTTVFNSFYREVVRLGAITRFTLGYVDSNRSRLLAQYEDFDRFRRDFEFSDDERQQFIEVAGEAGVEISREQFQAAEAELFRIMKGLVARDIWDMENYFMVINEEDPVIINALRIITDPEAYRDALGY